MWTWTWPYGGNNTEEEHVNIRERQKDQIHADRRGGYKDQFRGSHKKTGRKTQRENIDKKGRQR